MATFTNTSKPQILVDTNSGRSDLKITNLSNSTVYIGKGHQLENLIDNGFPIKQYGVFEFSTGQTYKGRIYILVSASSDVRVWES